MKVFAFKEYGFVLWKLDRKYKCWIVFFASLNLPRGVFNKYLFQKGNKSILNYVNRGMQVLTYTGSSLYGGAKAEESKRLTPGIGVAGLPVLNLVMVIVTVNSLGSYKTP